MVERQHHDDLLRETRTILSQAEELTGTPIRLIADPSLGDLAQARLVLAREPGAPHEIRFKLTPKDAPSRDHLIAHECGHLFRLWSAPPEERFLAAVHAEERRVAARKVRPQLEQLERLGLPDAAIRQVFDIWHQGIVLQLTNAPADLRIEDWLYRDHPALHASQRYSLGRLLERYVLAQFYRRMVTAPPLIRGANAELNAATALRYAGLFSDDSFIRHYPLYIINRSQRLLREALEGPDDGHQGDRRLTDHWAQRYGLRGWYRWIPVDQAGSLRHALDFLSDEPGEDAPQIEEPRGGRETR